MGFALIAVSTVSAVLAWSVQVLHFQFAEQIIPSNRALQSGAAGLYLAVPPYNC